MEWMNVNKILECVWTLRQPPVRGEFSVSPSYWKLNGLKLCNSLHAAMLIGTVFWCTVLERRRMTL